MENKLYAKISGPLIIGKSGKKTLYFGKDEDAKVVVNRYLRLIESEPVQNNQRRLMISGLSAWLVLQNPESIYDGVDGLCYEYPRSIPNGTRIDVGDYLICSLAKSKSNEGKRILGIGRISRIDEYTKEGEDAEMIYDF